MSVEALSRSTWTYVSQDGEICPVVTWYDVDGDETDDPDTAVVVVAQGARVWYSITLGAVSEPVGALH